MAQTHKTPATGFPMLSSVAPMACSTRESLRFMKIVEFGANGGVSQELLALAQRHHLGRTPSLAH